MAQLRGTKGPPLVAGTRQAWKVTFGLGGLIVAAVASVAQLVAPAELKAPVIGLAIGSGAVAIVAMLTVRCPSCGRSLGLWAFQTGTLTTWHERLVEATECPSCGHRPPADVGEKR